MKTKHIILLAAVFAAAFLFACNKEKILDPPEPTPDYRSDFEGVYNCRQVDILKQELTNFTIDTTYDGTCTIGVSVDYNLPGYIHVNEREIHIDQSGIFTEYKYFLKFVNDSIYIDKQFGSCGSYTDTHIFGKKQ